MQEKGAAAVCPEFGKRSPPPPRLLFRKCQMESFIRISLILRRPFSERSLGIFQSPLPPRTEKAERNVTSIKSLHIWQVLRKELSNTLFDNMCVTGSEVKYRSNIPTKIISDDSTCTGRSAVQHNKHPPPLL